MLALTNAKSSRLALAALSVLLAAACAKPAQKDYEDDDSAGGSGRVSSGGGGASTSGSQIVAIPVELVDKTGGFSLLANATAFTIQLTSCATGYTSTADEGSTNLQVYKFDRGCKAKLTTFDFGGKTYLPTAGDPFTTWAAGDTAVFDEAGEPGTAPLGVKVISTLDDPVSGTEAVVYQFTNLTKGADENIVAATVSDGHSMTVSEHPPLHFTIDDVAFTGVTATGQGQFVFTLECDSGIGATDICDQVDMNDITYKLVEDTYTANTLTLGEATGLFPAGEQATTFPADREAPGGATTNGGFHTITLDGPAAMATHPNMIFIMQVDNAAYLYFNVDVAVPTQD